MNDKRKEDFLRNFVKTDAAVEELLAYSKNKFSSINKPVLANDDYIKFWEVYAEEAKTVGVLNVLQKYFSQFRFPVKEGVSKTKLYTDATLRGLDVEIQTEQLELLESDNLKLEIYDSPLVGKVPILVTACDEDFKSIVCVLANKNEPKVYPNSMGAIFLNGIVNWQRIHKLRSEWIKKNPFGNWVEEFKNKVLPSPELFKDKLIVLSKKGYSGIKASQLKLTNDFWKEASLTIRKEHEIVHLFTLKNYGVMANNIHDEVIADYAGIVSVLGHFNKDWLLHFFGLEDYPDYRKGSRLENYNDPVKLSKNGFEGLKIIVKKSIDSIYKFDLSLGKVNSQTDFLNRIKSICEVDLITIASLEGAEKLQEVYNSYQEVTHYG